jgi:hypothetical protein
MNWLKKALCLAALAVFISSILLVPVAAFAQAAPAAKCEGPPELCAQILELRGKLDAQKALTDKDQGEKTAAVKAAEQSQTDRLAKAMAAAASIAVVLKLLLSGLKSWKGYFSTDKGKAWLKITTLGIGFIAFLLTNFGMGLSWWQALIVAGGGPGAILVHELSRLIPVVEGKKKYTSDAPPPPDVKPADPPADPPAA